MIGFLAGMIDQPYYGISYNLKKISGYINENQQNLAKIKSITTRNKKRRKNLKIINKHELTIEIKFIFF